MTYHVKPSNQFKKDLKTIQKRGYNLTLLTEVIQLLADGQKLPEKNRDHSLSGNFAGCRECHIAADWLLIYEIFDGDFIPYKNRYA